VVRIRRLVWSALVPPRRPIPIDLAERQHGVLLRSDLRAAGFGHEAIRHAVASGRLVRVVDGVFAIPGSPDTVERRVVAATLRLGGGLADRSAAAWFGLPGYEVEPIHVMRFRPGAAGPAGLAIVHRPRRLLAEHLTVWRGVAVTRPTRTLFDLAATAHPERVERTYDHAWSRGLVTTRSMDRCLAQLEGRGRSGVVLMRTLIDERRHLAQPTGSRLENRFEVLNRRAGIPLLRRQVDVGDAEGWIGRMDFVGEERRLVVEIDSDLHHAALLDARRDAARTERLRADGWEVLRISEHDLWHRAPWVVDELRAAWFRAPPARSRGNRA